MVTGYAVTYHPPELLSSGPHRDLDAELALFGQFVGTWDIRVRFFDDADAVVFDHPGVWSFGWVLDGRAVQDVLTYPNPRTGSSQPAERGIGTSLRYYEPTRKVWRVIWLGAVSGTLITLTGGAVGDEIHLVGRDPDGSRLRWTFDDIAPDAFRWRGHIRKQDGHWRLEQEMHGRRRAPSRDDAS